MQTQQTTFMDGTVETTAVHHYHVIENTPGYMPDSDDQTTFMVRADAVAYVDELTDELVEFIEYGPDEDGIARPYASVVGRGTGDVLVHDARKIYDLGRAIYVVDCFEIHDEEQN